MPDVYERDGTDARRRSERLRVIRPGDGPEGATTWRDVVRRLRALVTAKPGEHGAPAEGSARPHLRLLPGGRATAPANEQLPATIRRGRWQS
jgi:hypothetical protein